jgi:excisionase family DNA binding protein
MSDTNARQLELPAVLTSDDVAAALRISVIHARRILAAGKVPAVRRGRRWYCRRTDFFEFLTPTYDADAPGRSVRP